MAVRFGAGQDRMDPGESRDLFAFLALSLEELEKSVEATASAWERRSYWLKADQFRREWGWVSRSRGPLEAALTHGEWDSAAACGMELATFLTGRSLRVTRSATRPWDGAWKAWRDRRGESGTGTL